VSESADTLLDLAWRRFDENNQDIANLATSASIILAVDGVILGAIYSSSLIKSGDLLSLSTGIFLLSIGLEVWALFARKFTSLGLKEAYAILSLDFHDPDSLKLRLYSTLAEIEERNRKKISHLWAFFNIGAGALLVALILFVISQLSLDNVNPFPGAFLL
jgi:hypothetical protein